MDTPGSLVGQVLGRSYRLDELLAEGGASLIFAAERQRPPRRKVVVKLLHPLLTNDDEMVARFNQEAEVLGELRHVNAVELLDMGHTAEDLPYHVLELLEGETLQERLDRDGPLPAPEVAAVVAAAAAALQALHDLKVVHRDVTPRNLFLRGGDPEQVKLMDFGLALRVRGERKRGEPEVMGTEGYMSPEQFRGEVHAVDASSDTFALAVVAYEALSGKRPFEAEDAEELLRKVCGSEPTPLTARVKGLTPDVNGVMSRALAKSAEDRYVSVETFADELAVALESAAPAVETPPARPEEEPPHEVQLAPEPEDAQPAGDTVQRRDTPPVLEVNPAELPGTPKKAASPPDEPPQDAALAGQTLLGEDDLLDELLAAGGEGGEEPEPEADPLAGQTLMDDDMAPAVEDTALAGQTLMDGDLDVGGEDSDPLAGQTLMDGDLEAAGPGSDPLAGQTLMDDVLDPEPQEDEALAGGTLMDGALEATTDEGGSASDEVESRDPSLAGHTLVGEDDLLDELRTAEGGGSGDAGRPETAPQRTSGKSAVASGEIVTVFKGEAWERAERGINREPEPSTDRQVTTAPVQGKQVNRVLPVAITIGVVVALAMVLYLLAR